MPTGAKTAKILQKQLFGGELEALTGSKPISASQDILAELENALKGREKIELNSTHRFNRIFKDHSVLCPTEGLHDTDSH